MLRDTYSPKIVFLFILMHYQVAPTVYNKFWKIHLRFICTLNVIFLFCILTKDDCPDGSDESESCHRNPCPSEMFTCNNGHCIDLLLKCNAVNDCKDNSDEQYCTEKTTSNFVNCTADEHRCYNTDMCLPKSVKYVIYD